MNGVENAVIFFSASFYVPSLGLDFKSLAFKHSSIDSCWIWSCLQFQQKKKKRIEQTKKLNFEKLCPPNYLHCEETGIELLRSQVFIRLQRFHQVKGGQKATHTHSHIPAQLLPCQSVGHRHLREVCLCLRKGLIWWLSPLLFHGPGFPSRTRCSWFYCPHRCGYVGPEKTA